MSLLLRPFALADEPEVLAAQTELARDSFRFLVPEADDVLPWPDRLERLAEVARGENLGPDRVRAVLLAAEVGGEIVGRASIRFALNDWLRRYGGHIGYAVRPAYRRRGYATEILRQSLIIARAGGVRDVMVCCTDDNIGSATAIESCGGVLEDKISDEAGALIRRYWIAY